MSIKPFLFFLLLPVLVPAQNPVTGKVYYDSDHAVRRLSHDSVLDSVLFVLKTYPASRLNIIGYTDNTHTFEHNLDLSLRRAREIYEILLGKGIEPKRLSYLGLGPLNPDASNDTPEGRERNRRVEFDFMNIKHFSRYAARDSFQKEIRIRTKKISLKLHDDVDIDGDIVTVRLNGKTIVENCRIDGNKKLFLIENLKFGANVMEVIAVNQGTIGAATPYVEIRSGTSEWDFMISSYYKKPAKIKITVEN